VGQPLAGAGRHARRFWAPGPGTGGREGGRAATGHQWQLPKRKLPRRWPAGFHLSRNGLAQGFRMKWDAKNWESAGCVGRGRIRGPGPALAPEHQIRNQIYRFTAGPHHQGIFLIGCNWGRRGSSWGVSVPWQAHCKSGHEPDPAAGRVETDANSGGGKGQGRPAPLQVKQGAPLAIAHAPEGVRGPTAICRKLCRTFPFGPRVWFAQSSSKPVHGRDTNRRESFEAGPQRQETGESASQFRVIRLGLGFFLHGPSLRAGPDRLGVDPRAIRSGPMYSRARSRVIGLRLQRVEHFSASRADCLVTAWALQDIGFRGRAGAWLAHDSIPFPL